MGLRVSKRNMSWELIKSVEIMMLTRRTLHLVNSRVLFNFYRFYFNFSEKRRGMDRQRNSKMLKAKIEMGKNEIRICPSVFSEDNVKCKYGDKCLALHSKEEYWAKKPPDIGFLLNLRIHFIVSVFRSSLSYL